MKAKIYFHINMTSPVLEIASEEDAIGAVKLFCTFSLKMPRGMIKAISIEKVETIKEG